MKKILLILASVRITVVCLFLLFVLTFWGTVAQVSQGLYAAQERFFNSLYFLAAGRFPFPGAQLVLWVLFINLSAATITRFIKYRKWQYAGILIIHFGLILYFVAAYVTFQVSKESYVHLREGEGTNVSSSYHEWELVYSTSQGQNKELISYDTKGFKSGAKVLFSQVPWSMEVVSFYANCNAFTKAWPANGIKTINDSGITLVQEKPLSKEREKNVVGGIFNIKTADHQQYNLLLYGLDPNPTPVTINNKTFYFSLRPKKFPLPFTIKLDKFEAQFHPGTQTAKSYESYVQVIKPSGSRQAHIYMNNPLREKDFTFYQASYSVDDSGQKFSTLAVVQNAGRVLPYVACIVVFLGLALHFLITAFTHNTSRKCCGLLSA